MSQPAMGANSAAPRLPIAPYAPHTEATRPAENRSEGRVKNTELFTWMENMPSDISAMATYGDPAVAAGMAPSIRRAPSQMTNLREKSMLRPFLMMRLDSQPPNQAPRSAATNGIQANSPISRRLKPRSSARYSGSQKTKK